MRGRVLRWTLPLALLAVLGAGAAVAATGTATTAATVKMAKTKLGTVLVAGNGRVLYRFTKDRKGVDTCAADKECNEYWPRLLVSASGKVTAGAGAKAGLLGKIKQPKGLWQVTYAGYPLYFFAGDKAAGQTNGQAVEKVWFVVDAQGGLVKTAAAGGGGSPAPATTSTTTTSTTGGGGGGGGNGWG